MRLGYLFIAVLLILNIFLVILLLAESETGQATTGVSVERASQPDAIYPLLGQIEEFERQSLGPGKAAIASPSQIARAFLRSSPPAIPAQEVVMPETKPVAKEPEEYRNFEYIGVVNRDGERIFSFRDRERNTVFTVGLGGTWFDWVLLESGDGGFLFERSGMQYRVDH